MTMGTSDEVQEALKEASQTAYVRGRWIYSSNQYRIVAPVLPCLGDYSQYNICGRLKQKLVVCGYCIHYFSWAQLFKKLLARIGNM